MLKPESNSNSKKSENCIKIYQDIILKENWSRICIQVKNKEKIRMLFVNKLCKSGT